MSVPPAQWSGAAQVTGAIIDRTNGNKLTSRNDAGRPEHGRADHDIYCVAGRLRSAGARSVRPPPGLAWPALGAVRISGPPQHRSVRRIRREPRLAGQSTTHRRHPQYGCSLRHGRLPRSCPSRESQVQEQTFSGATRQPRRAPQRNSQVGQPSRPLRMTYMPTRSRLDRCVNAVVAVWLRTASECVICATFQLGGHRRVHALVRAELHAARAACRCNKCVRGASIG
jgi:hypothetical protein